MKTVDLEQIVARQIQQKNGRVLNDVRHPLVKTNLKKAVNSFDWCQFDDVKMDENKKKSEMDMNNKAPGQRAHSHISIFFY